MSLQTEKHFLSHVPIEDLKATHNLTDIATILQHLIHDVNTKTSRQDNEVSSKLSSQRNVCIQLVPSK